MSNSKCFISNDYVECKSVDLGGADKNAETMIKKWLQEIFDNNKSIEFKEWRTDNSILNFLTSNLDEKGTLSEKAHDLPDEKKDHDKVRFAPGLMDAMFGADDSDDSKKELES